MALQSIPDPPGFDDLPPAEQIEYLQRLWDRVAADEAAVPVPDSHRQLLAERLADHRANPEAGEPAYEMLDRLAQKLR